LDHDVEAVVLDLRLFLGEHRAGEDVGRRGVAGREGLRPDPEDEAAPQEVPPRESVDAAELFHLDTYFSWNSGDARRMSQRVASSGLELSSCAVAGETTPSRCVTYALPYAGTVGRAARVPG